jgi:hypothetical protein
MQLSNQTITDSGLETYLQSIYNLDDATTSVAVKLINKGLEIEEVIAIAATKDLQTLTTVFSLLEENLDQEAVVDAALGVTNNCKSLESIYTEHHSYAYEKIKTDTLVAA